VDWTAGQVGLLTQARPWEPAGRPRRAGISSFGISGTNAHVILEQIPEEPAPEPAPAPPPAPAALPWVISAPAPDALRAQAARLADWPGEPADIARSLVTDRSLFTHRAVVVGRDRDTLTAGLLAIAAGSAESAGHAVTGAAQPEPGPVVFVFPGQGSQWAGMARDLMVSSPVFAATMAECDAAIAKLTGWSVTEVVCAVDAPTRVDVVQPALFAVMVSLAAVWRSWGVEPAAVIGHSQGEIAAACVAGGLSIAEAAAVVVLRSRALEKLAGAGGMLAVPLSRADAEQRLRDRGGPLAMAAVNGPHAVVVSGEVDALDVFAAELAADGVDARRIPVDYASHSAQVDCLADVLAQELAAVRPRSGSVPMWSTVTGGWHDIADMDAAYWFANLRRTVGFEAAIAGLLDAGHGVFVEVSPHPVLTAGIRDTAESGGRDDVTVAGSLRRDHGGLDRMLVSAAELLTRGVAVDWTPMLTGRSVELPTYAFQRQRYWLGRGAGGADVAAVGVGVTGHPLLGAAVDLPDGGVVLTGRLSLRSHPWLAGHVVGDRVLLPGTAFVEALTVAGDRVGLPVIDDLTITAPIELPARGAVRIRVTLTAVDGVGLRRVVVHACPGEDVWTEHASGVLGRTGGEPAGLKSWPPAGAVEADLTDVYDRLADNGYRYGPAFTGLRRMWRLGSDTYAEIQLDQLDDDYLLHPALFDSALHPMLLDGGGGGGGRLPFAWRGVRCHASGATRLRVRITPAGADTASVVLADSQGAPVASVDSLALRPAGSGPGHTSSLYVVDLVRADMAGTAGDPANWIVLGGGLPFGVPVADLAAVRDRAPAMVLAPLTARDDLDVPAAARTLAHDVLGLVRDWLADERWAGRELVVVTNGDRLADAAVRGLLRTAWTENPGRFRLVHLERGADPSVLPAALATGEPELVVRGGDVLAPRLVPSHAALVPQGTSWRLGISRAGTLDNLELVPADAATRPLESGHVRVAVRAAGLNFRDVLMALGMYPGDIVLGSEAAGVVMEVAPDVTDFAPGDRVMGIVLDAFGPVAVADRRMLAPLPEGWSFPQAAAVPVVYLTAYYGLVDLAGLRAGESVLVHAATGGVGMAAVQLARHLGAEIYGTTSPAKRGVLREMGLDDAHSASSRSLDYEEQFRAVDVVLNSLAREHVDASLRLTRPGGRFLEMGKTDVRRAADVAAAHDGVTYRAYDLLEAGPDRIGQMLTEVLGLFRAGVLTPLPVRAWDVRRAPEAFRYMREARHTGKNVLTVAPESGRQGTVLITGGTGLLGGLFARHLVRKRGVRDLVLASRQGLAAPGAAGLAAELTAGGASIEILACDLADRAAVARLLDGIPRLVAVIHAAGVLDDGIITALTDDQVDRVFAPKVDAAWHLHELTLDRDLSAYVLFSSIAGTSGAAGQANYAAANAFADELARHRAAAGLPAQSLAWGLWAQASSMTGHLTDQDKQRLARSGVAPMTSEEGLALFDAALGLGEPVVVAAKLVRPSVWRPAAGRTVADTGTSGATLAETLAVMRPAQQLQTVLDLVAAQVAAVLGHRDPRAVRDARTFRELGVDSLSAVELRNRLNAVTGVRMPATLVFDHPSPVHVAELVLNRLDLPGPERTVLAGQALPADLDDATDDELFALVDQGHHRHRQG